MLPWAFSVTDVFAGDLHLNRTMRGINYIAFEGIDGCGKSQQVEMLCERLVALNYTPIRLFEPTNGRYGMRMRSLKANEKAPSVEEQMQQFTLDRKQHVEHKIKPLLEMIEAAGSKSGFKIVQDRSYYSAPAYQAMDERSIAEVLELQKRIAPPPDLVFLIDVPVHVARARISQRKGSETVFEKHDNLKRVRKTYLYLASQVNSICVIDGTKNPDDVCETICGRLSLGPFDPDIQEVL